MTIVGIDFSIQYPGICICKDFKEFKWLGFINTKISKKYRKQLDDLNYKSIKLFYTQSTRQREEEYHLMDRVKIINYLELIDLIVNTLKEELDLNDQIICCLEGLSFGSKGNALIDLSQATGMLKYKVINDILNGDASRFFVFSPTELKKTIHNKGNASKYEILTNFMKNPILKSIITSDLYTLFRKEEWTFKNDKIASPFVDMVDAYLNILKIYQLSK